MVSLVHDAGRHTCAWSASGHVVGQACALEAACVALGSVPCLLRSILGKQSAFPEGRAIVGPGILSEEFGGEMRPGTLLEPSSEGVLTFLC